MSAKKPFRTEFSETIFNEKYKHEGCETWEQLSSTLIDDVCRNYLTPTEKEEIKEIHSLMQFIAGGRYLYYAGRKVKYFNNCYLLKALEDTKEDWADLSWKNERCLMTGGGIGTDYSIYRAEGTPISRTGGVSTGPLAKIHMTNEQGRKIMQGGSRRSAIYASLNWLHGDNIKFLHCKDWYNMPVRGAYDKTGNPMSIGHLKEADFNYPAPMDMTNISLNYDNKFLEALYGDFAPTIYDHKDQHTAVDIKHIPEVFIENVLQACKTSEPGMSFNFYDKEKETLRNACTEVTSEDDSDVCNLGSVNMSRIETKEDFRRIIRAAARFLLCGTLVADLPYDKVKKVREKNRRLGLGLMGIHEWLLKRGYQYEVVSELKEWLQIYKDESKAAADELADRLGISHPVAYRALAPTGTIGIIAGTTTSIEPLFAVAFKRRYLKNGKDWHYQYVVDGTAKILINQYGIAPEKIESAIDLAINPERRIKFQADVQDYVDMSISSTINLPAWSTQFNNEDTVKELSVTLAKYAHRLRGFTCYADGSRGGQPLTPVPYHEAVFDEGKEFAEEYTDVCAATGHGGSCGV